MDFGHDTELALAGAVDLVNTGLDVLGHEGIPDLPALQRFIDLHRVSDVGDLRPDDLTAVRRLRGRVAAVLRAAEDADAVALANAVVAEARTTPRLSEHDGWPLHIHYFAPGARVAEHLAADTGMALIHLLAAGERDRFQECAAPDCRRVLVDLSRNRSRRYCDSRTCGNRLHVAAYRARRRAV